MVLDLKSIFSLVDNFFCASKIRNFEFSICGIIILLVLDFPNISICLSTWGIIQFVFSMEVAKGIYYDTSLNLYYPEGM